MKKKELDDIYQEVFEDALHYMAEDHTVQAVAATYMAIAMRLYKTHLTDEDYKKMIKTVIETETLPFDLKETLH
jgi:hypothetical protein|tara:strand:- start:233 stop:454 length:222 start_codon:yes stop_codon:yes gene_type:complete